MRKSLFIKGLLCSTLVLSATAWAKSGYQPSGDCGGLAKINVSTPKGFCVGLVADGFKFPRGILPLNNGDLLLVDMGGWVENRGSVWRLRPQQQGKLSYSREKLLSGLDRPSNIVLGPDDKIYVSTVTSVFRFDLTAPAKTKHDVIGGDSGVMALPGTGRHPLTQLVFDADKNLLVSVGSASDNCANEDNSPPNATKACPETVDKNPRGVIRKYTMRWPEGKVLSNEVLAAGLRNAMALAVNPKNGDVWQAENSRDAIAQQNPALSDEKYPHEELNLIKKNLSYGWPYCYDNNQPAPEYATWDCSKYQAPVVLLPPHAAPLGMVFYQTAHANNSLNNHLLVGFHGYRNTGHRIMAYPLDAKYMPSLPPLELVGNWSAKKGTPTGAPVDVKQGLNGEIYITEDRNGAVLRLIEAAP